jgi:hypothetical protein
VRSPSWPLAGAVAGLAVALAVTLLQGSTYRADASLVLVSAGQPPGSDPRLAPVARAAAELFESRAVAASVVANLGLDDAADDLVERLDAEADPESSLVRLSVEAPSQDEARRTAQEAAEISTVLFNDRFGPRTTASVWEAAEAEPERVAPKPARNLAYGALAGALAGWALFLVARRRARAPRRPWREPEMGTVPGTVPIRDEPVASAMQERSGTVPGTVPHAAAEPAAGPFVLPGFGEWTIGDVERLVAEQGSAFPERQEEIELYVDALRGVAGADGRLPGDVDLVIEDVFADLIARSGSRRRA